MTRSWTVLDTFDAGLVAPLRQRRADDFARRTEAACRQPRLELVDQPNRQDRIRKYGRAHLDRRRAGGEELERIVERANSADSDDRYIDDLRHLVDHAQGDRLECRAGQPAVRVAKQW